MLKTYPNLNLQDRGINFSIARMEDIYDKRNGAPDEPHRHDYFTVVIPIKAKGIHNIDFNEYTLSDGQIFFVNEGQVHQIIEHERSLGYAIVFSADFLIRHNIPVSFIHDINLFAHFGASPPLLLAAVTFKKVISYCEEIFLLQNEKQKFASEAISSYLKLILILCNNSCTHQPRATHETESGERLLKSFKELVNEKYTTWHSVKEYSESLFVSADYLNKVVKSLIGKTAKEYIQNRIIIGAKRLLFHTAFSSKEIAYELGFGEPAHFSSFFKKCTGQSPSNFKKSFEN